MSDTSEMIMSHDDIKSAFNEIYNNYYLGYRLTEKRIRSDKEWEEILKKGNELLDKYHNSQFIHKTVYSVIEIWEKQEYAIRNNIDFKL